MEKYISILPHNPYFAHATQKIGTPIVCYYAGKYPIVFHLNSG